MKQFETDKKESFGSRKFRWLLNVWPCIWCTGSKVEFVAADYKELHVSLQLNLRSRNRVGTVFGGSIYSSVDPYFMLMLMNVLGKEYVVWDKGASMKFLKPIVQKVKCRFLLSDELIEEIKNKIAENGELSFDLPLHYEDDNKTTHAVFTKTLYVASKAYYKQKQVAKQKKN